MKTVGDSKGLEESQIRGVGRMDGMEGFGGQKFGCSEKCKSLAFH